MPSGAGTPGGSSESVQFNDAGSFGGIGPTASAYAGWDSGGNAAVIVPGLEARTDADGTAALLSTDRAKQVNVSNASANAVSIAQAGTAGFEAGYVTYACQTGAGATTITPTTSTINGAATFVWNTQYACARVRSDGTNYEAALLSPSVGGGLADPGANGVVVRTALNTTTARTITGTANEVTVTNGDGVSGNPTLSLDADIGALGANATNGLWARTGAGTGSARTITGTANEITVTNGDGVSGNPTISLPIGAVKLQLPGGITWSCTGYPSDCYYSIDDFVRAGAVCAQATAGEGRPCGEGGMWWLAGSDGAFSSGETGANATPSHPGTRRLIAGNVTPVAGEQAEIQYTAASGTFTWDTLFDQVDVVELTDVCTSGDFRYGISQDSGADPPTHGVYFEQLAADTNIFMVVRAAAAQTRFDTGLTCTDSAYYTRRIRRTNSTTIAYAICQWTNDTTPCTLPAERTICASGCDDTSANVPSGSTEARGTYFVQTQTTAAKILKLDFHFIGITGIVR